MTGRRATKVGILAGVLVVTAGLFLSCGGGGGGGGGGGTISTKCAEFGAASAPAQGIVATSENAGTTCSVLALDVVVTDITDLYTASFRVSFDGTIVTYQGYSTTGSVLASDGTQLQVLEQQQPGEVSLGVTRLSATDGIDVVGSATVLRIYFQKTSVDSGTFDLVYPSGSLLGSETPPQPKAGIQWFGGTVEID